MGGQRGRGGTELRSKADMSEQGRTHLNGDLARAETERGLAEFQARSHSEKFDVMVARLEIEELREPEFLQALVYWHT